MLIAGCATVAPSSPQPVPAPPPPPLPSVHKTMRAPIDADAGLASLTVSPGGLDQAFQPVLTEYTSTQGFLVSRLRVVAQANDARAAVTVGDGAPAAGRAVARIPLAVGANSVRIAVTAADGVTTRDYRLEVRRNDLDTLAQRVYAKASNTGANDLFGYALALHGDTLAVGAYLEDSFAGGIDGDQTDDSADGSGAVYVFARHGEDWIQQAYIKGRARAGGAQFGRTLALSGDTLAVGAPSDGRGGAGVDPEPNAEPLADSGAVHVFRRRDGRWESEAYIKASDAAAGDLFGSAVALSGDTLAVGAYLRDGGARDSGAAYVFQRRDGDWIESARIEAPRPQTGAGFGYAVALSGDTLAVGAHLEDGGERGEADTGGGGAVHVYVRSAGRWTPQALLRADAPAINDLFGASLALAGDTLAVGAHLEDSDIDGAPAENSGAVYVYERRQGIWSRRAHLKASPGGAGYRFGRGLALNGDVLAVGASLEDSAGTGVSPPPTEGRQRDAGAVYLYTRGEEGWSPSAHIKASNTGAGDMFGYAIALSGDTLAVGAPNESSAATGTGGRQDDERVPGSGAAYLFR